MSNEKEPIKMNLTTLIIILMLVLLLIGVNVYSTNYYDIVGCIIMLIFIFIFKWDI